MAGESVPTSFHKEVEHFLKAYKRLEAKERKDGNVDEMSADPIPFSLYLLILEWAISSNNIFVWYWSLCQWNNMPRMANIDPLAFYNYTVGSDSIKCKYDDAKADKEGEKLTEKSFMQTLLIGKLVGGLEQQSIVV